MPDHLEPMELAGVVTLGEWRTIGSASVIVKSTGDVNKFYVRVIASGLAKPRRVRHRKVIDRSPPDLIP